MVFPAGSIASWLSLDDSGMTSEQSMSASLSCPSVVSFVITRSNLAIMTSWWSVQVPCSSLLQRGELRIDDSDLLIIDCHSQADLGSRSRSTSDWSRNSPGRGELASPCSGPFPVGSVPRKSVFSRNERCGDIQNQDKTTHFDEKLTIEVLWR